MTETKEYIGSLHRPFNIRLKTIKWVCEFTKTYNGDQFRIDLFIYIISLLYKEYNFTDSIYGLPLKETVIKLKNFMNENILYREKLLEFTVGKKNEGLDKQIYSNLKAVSYYTTLAKNLGFLDNGALTQEGELLISLQNSRKGIISLTSKEQNLFVQQLLRYDFIPFVFTVYYTYFEKKYSLKNTENEVFNQKFLKELDLYLNTRDFKLKRASWKNYIIVRQAWIKDLELIQSNNTIKNTFKKIIESNKNQKKEFYAITLIIKEFEKSFFKKLEKFRIFKENLYLSYIKIKKDTIFGNIGYINLYDIKTEMKISFKELEIFLDMLYEEEVNRKNIFFNNIVAAIDNRKRFKVKNTQVLNIKMTGKLL